jgi:hypothetical protein
VTGNVVDNSHMNQPVLRSVLSYSPETGEFVWLERAGKFKSSLVGTVAGGPQNRGYLRIAVFGKRYLAHRLAWFYVHDEWPKEIDHINGCRTDNRLCNLRASTVVLNRQNQRHSHKDSQTGLLGVRKMGKSFQSRINLNGKVKHLGTFKSATEAFEAYLIAKRVMHDSCSI